MINGQMQISGLQNNFAEISKFYTLIINYLKINWLYTLKKGYFQFVQIIFLQQKLKFSITRHLNFLHTKCVLLFIINVPFTHTTCLAVQSYGNPLMRTITWAPLDKKAWASLLVPPATAMKSSPGALYTSMYLWLM